ncbi:UvrABC system protein C [Thermoclostridium stercorarium subsp. stercorarium DSM 8532]|jgi:excinuclease ABC subunit C|uniref:UvrABC system protein C n=2 Tax=Thermoclostridium stercorarium TaxID=1510 RepID=L7VUW7_THES1|nr:excinuclease ABC subunit UvrC [Thermoclostridium stercorarium]AGC69378.1 UvrABC system protein C [Thermoclostridium stercorarium subsp. stercorarium DSM 8532]AGI40338.1 excinuclease subunit C [Thermoclostridium stercorarium subsp. stercorarium DSM 8532]ANW99632.1 excinuclease ABC subunit C [Thermoclostridium stercorarium subsp. thermolacticum DSM 2910]
MDRIRELLENIPESPGVYLMKDKSGRIIYVGKAKVLKNRVRQYFQSPEEKDPKTKTLVSKINTIETIVTETEAEALILENTLIKLHKPRYNILLKDDKTYPYIRITTQELFPKIELTRTIKRDGSRYFGAYTKVSDARKSLEALRKIFPLRTCNRQIKEGDNQRPCLFYHIKLCSAPCAGLISSKDYNEIVKETYRFLEGRQDEVLNEMRKRMEAYAENLEFEKAASIRDKIKSITKITEKQLVLSTKFEDRDLCALVRDEINSLVIVLFVRNGKLMGKNVNFMEKTYNMSDEEVMEVFLTQFYGNGREIPPEILLTHYPASGELIEQWLKSVRGKSVNLSVPVRGDRKKQIDLAVKNAEEEFQKYRINYVSKQEDIETALDKLKEILELPDIPHRIEAYDISNTGNKGMVAGMVVFEDGIKKTSHYRKYEIKSINEQNDYACMQEVLYRRLKRLKEGDEDASFSERPDLILIDGGIGHVHAAEEVFAELGMSIPVAGMAKNDKHRTQRLVNDKIDIELKEEPELHFLIAAIQEEVHRYSLSFHKLKRKKLQKESILDEIEGIGPKRKKALLKKFGSVKRIREATVEELCSVKGISRKLAEEIKESLS